ncbi:S1 family peptidase [Dehalococcoidia bacterium]|nr:S1 family peptidase [Dehalococcoidia bacterium]
MVRPGSGIRNVKAEEFVTFGAYGVTRNRKVMLVTPAHGIVYFIGGEGAIGDPLVRVKTPVEKQELGEFRRLSLNGKEFGIQGVKLSSFRISGIGEDVPAVLKAPAEATEGGKVVKSGAATGVTSGQIMETSYQITVKFSDGRKAKFADQIRTSRMASQGDSGSLLLTADSFEPLGLLVAVDRSSTYFCKMTNVINELRLLGVFCPLSLPSGSTPFLRYLANQLIWDGRYEQKGNLNAKNPDEILEELGVESISQASGGNWNVIFRDTCVVSMPFVGSDSGNILTDQDDRAVGVIVAGNKKVCVAMPIKKLLKAFKLSILF